MVNLFVATFLKFFFLLTPFFVISSFLALARDFSIRQKRVLAVRVTVAVMIVCLVIFYLGNWVFSLFGITLDAFRVGTGILLMLSAIALIRGDGGEPVRDKEEIAVVPLAIPITVGPATTGALLVMGGELDTTGETLVGLAALAASIFLVGALLFVSSSIEQVVKRQGLTILSKVTGLILSALAAQLVMNGIAGFMSGLPGS